MEAATTTQQAVPPPRLRDTYNNEVLPKLMETFGYSTPMRAPRLQKITLNMGLGSSVDSKSREKAIEELATIAGQMPNTRIAKKSIASFKLREGMPVGASVTLRGARMWEFLDRLNSIAIPRIRDFRGLKATSFDGRGNYSMGVREQLIFPEIDYDSVDETRGLDITITTSAPTDYEAFELLLGLGMPFATEGRPVPEGAEAAPAEAPAEEAEAEEAADTENDAADEASEDDAAAEETQEDQA
jgi:large subunit ribosomal protein L5